MHTLQGKTFRLLKSYREHLSKQIPSMHFPRTLSGSWDVFIKITKIVKCAHVRKIFVWILKSDIFSLFKIIRHEKLFIRPSGVFSRHIFRKAIWEIFFINFLSTHTSNEDKEKIFAQFPWFYFIFFPSLLNCLIKLSNFSWFGKRKMSWDFFPSKQNLRHKNIFFSIDLLLFSS